MSEDVMTRPVEVSIKNWDDAPKPDKKTIRTTLHTYVIDPGNADLKKVQIASYEPNRVRMVVQVLDVPVVLYLESPVTSPEAAPAVGNGYSGRLLMNSQVYDYCFYGNDSFWINSVTGTPGRVTVTKEYTQ